MEGYEELRFALDDARAQLAEKEIEIQRLREEIKKRKRSMFWVKLLVVGFILIFICGPAMIAVSGDDDDATPTVEPTAVVEAATLEPTATDEPTLEPTDEPTSTPRPTNTPSTNDEFMSYGLEVVPHVENWQEDFNDLSNLGMEMVNQPALIQDSSWREDVAETLANIKFTNRAVRNMSVPDSMSVVHDHLIDASNHYDDAVDYYAQGIDEVDPDLIEMATESIRLGNAAMNRATDALEGVLG